MVEGSKDRFVTVRLSADELEAIDRVAAKEERTRSDTIRRMLRRYLERNDR